MKFLSHVVFPLILFLSGCGEDSNLETTQPLERNGSADDPAQGENEVEEQADPLEAMKELRMMMLTTSPADFGIESSNEFPEVYGVIMEFPISEITASVVSLSDGNASLYTTSTFGVIGGLAHDNVRTAATRLVKAAGAFHDEAKLTTEFPYPESDKVRFYLLTYSEVRQIEDNFNSVESKTSRLSDLFMLGQDVLTQLRLTTEGHQTLKQ